MLFTQSRAVSFYCLMFVTATIMCGVSAPAQIITTTKHTTDGKTPAGLQPGTPAGSYPLSGFDNVNAFNGNLTFRLPLVPVTGRGSAQMMVTLALNLKSWHIKHTHKEMPDGNTIDTYVPVQTGWAPFGGYGAGRLDGRNYGVQTSSNMSCRWYSKTLSRLTFSTADGTEFELRDQLSNGAPLSSTCSQGASRGTVFITADGSAATFISDVPLYDNPAINAFGPHNFSVSGVLMMKDGTRYRIDNSTVTWIRDRNGNKISFTYSANGMTITDQLNRTITINYNVSDVAPYGLCDQIILKGFGGAQRILRVSKTALANALRPNSGYSIRTLGGAGGLFPETNGSTSTTHNPTVKSAVWLPDGRSYKLFYNSYGEVARVELPTGGAYEYDMTPGSGVICPNFCWPDDDREIYRRLVERRVYSNGTSGGSFDHREIYSNTETLGTDSSTVTVEHLGPTGAVLARSRHYFSGSALNSLFGGAVVIPYPAWWEGNETQTDILDTSGSLASATVLRRTVTTRTNRTPVPWWPNTYQPSTMEPPNDLRVTSVVTTLEPATANLVSRQTFGYDDSVPFNNENNIKEYGFGIGSPGPLLREARTTYLTSPAYTGTNVHIRNLPIQTSLFEGVTERARSTIEYDNYVPDSYHTGLVNRPNMSGFDSAFTTSYTTRGNATSATDHILVNGVITKSISTYSQYDIAGNIVKVIDARSTPSDIIASTIEYDDRFGSPDNEARSNTAPIELTGISSFAFPTKVINALGHTAYAQFDYYLGKPVNGEDPNGVVDSGYFSDPLDRPTKVRRAIGSTRENQTTFQYDDVNRVVRTISDRSVNEDNLLVGELRYDQLGRPIEARQYEGGSNYIVTKTEYDGLGRAFRTAKPFRPWQNETAAWTTQVFDALGRVTSITTPDGAVAATAYSGDKVLATDEVGKQRISRTNALGHLTDVWEITTPDSATEAISFPSHPEVTAGYRTSYGYDVLDNLTTVTQGTQTRTFVGDSLRRLKSATNPESGTVTYEYDDNSNIIVKTDARGVSTHFEYDKLNRLTRRWYNGSSSVSSTTHNSPALPLDVGATAEAKFYYDSQTLPAGAPSYARGSATGRLVAQTYGAGSNGDYYAYDVLGRQTMKIQQTGTINYQISADYNASGGIARLYYPSGHTVDNIYDEAGRLLTFSGNLGDGVTRTYAANILYSPFGGLVKEQFGTTTPIFNKLFYNSRGQLAEIRVSTSYTGPLDTTWNRGAIINHYSDQCWGMCSGSNMTDNDGNLKKQDTYIPSDDQISSYTLRWQQYEYDNLKRLLSVREIHNGSEQWKQQFTYDRWGNRTINSGVTYGISINNKAFDVNTATNRLGVPAGQSGAMTYDAVGNLITDSYTGFGSRTFDAENRMTTAANNTGQTTVYTYDVNGRRVKRHTGSSQEMWQVYGIDNELLAEYRVGSLASAPEKEYGYRNGQLLVTTGSGDTIWSEDAVPAGAAIAGDAESWNWVSSNPGPFSGGSAHQSNIVAGLHQHYFYGATATLNVSAGDKLVAYVYLDPSNMPSQIMLQWAEGGSWEHRAYWGANNLPWGVNGTDSRRYMGPLPTAGVWVKLEVPASLVGLEGRTLHGMAFSMWGGRATWDRAGKASSVQWLVADHLGTPRMQIDQTGSLAGVRRHDHLPFGEELFAPISGRSSAQGFADGDGVRQQYTAKERDSETGLDYFKTRYYSSLQGRFTGPDALFADQDQAEPQSWNLYTYVGNRPTTFTDPFGLWRQVPCDNGGQCWQAEAGDNWASLAWDAGIGGHPAIEAAYLAAYFSTVSTVVEGETTVDVSGYQSWKKSLDLRQHLMIQSKIQYDFDFGVGGGLRNVTKTVRSGGVISRIGRWFSRRKAPKPPGVLTGSLKGLTQAERSMVDELLAQGKNVQIIPRGAGKTADFIIDGVITELKTLTQAGPNTLKNAVEKAAEQSPQAILIDARNVLMTQQDAILQIARAQGNVGGLQGRVTVWTRFGIVTY